MENKFEKEFINVFAAKRWIGTTKHKTQASDHSHVMAHVWMCTREQHSCFTIRYDTINYTYVRSKADEETAYSAAQNQQTKRVTKKQKQDAQKQRFSYKVRTVSPDDKHEV